MTRHREDFILKIQMFSIQNIYKEILQIKKVKYLDSKSRKQKVEIHLEKFSASININEIKHSFLA